jgi:hypothetical protein
MWARDTGGAASGVKNAMKLMPPRRGVVAAAEKKSFRRVSYLTCRSATLRETACAEKIDGLTPPGLAAEAYIKKIR